MKFFDYNSGFMRFSLLLSRLTLLNLIWLLCCIPLVTAGASTAAQYYSIKQLMNGDTAVFKNFRTGMKLYWKGATITWLILAVLSGIFSMAYYILTTADIPARAALLSVAALAFLTLLLTMLWVYPVMINFVGNLREIFFNAFIFTFMYAPLTLIAAAFYVAAGFLLIRFILTRGLVILFGQALVVYANLNLFDKAFQKYRKTDEAL
ncbi:MAG: DUF624 domain-containing protein [Dorea sp.]|uniref:DUF624 domain-containing protein n=1 Tax=Sporofaciens musculi TaxID=2681861 RepID=UPI002172315A|nr:DUF624 domain-containing protein [Sporofaciens musculi]MCI9422027.1 DUF624 domain-containing protein [Dorea sp.]